MKCLLVLLAIALGLISFSIVDAQNFEIKVPAGNQSGQTPGDTGEYYISATTPRICENLTETCGFQVYEKDWRIVQRFLKYCECPEGQECRYYCRNYSGYFFRYRCFPIDSTESMPGTEGTETSDLEERIGYLHHPEDL